MVDQTNGLAVFGPTMKKRSPYSVLQKIHCQFMLIDNDQIISLACLMQKASGCININPWINNRQNFCRLAHAGFPIA